MNKFKVVCVALVAVCALSGLASSSASADELINEKGGLVQGAINLNQKTAQVLETLAGVKVTCQDAVGNGSQTGKMTVTINSVKFKKCVKSTGGTCKTAGAEPEEIVIGALDGELVSNTAKTELLLLVELLNAVEFTCGEVKVAVKAGGKFLATVQKQKEFRKEFTLVAKCSAAGMQELTKYIDLTGVEKTISEAAGLLTKIGAVAAFEGSCQSGEATAELEQENGKIV